MDYAATNGVRLDAWPCRADNAFPSHAALTPSEETVFAAGRYFVGNVAHTTLLKSELAAHQLTKLRADELLRPRAAAPPQFPCAADGAGDEEADGDALPFVAASGADAEFEATAATLEEVWRSAAQPADVCVLRVDGTAICGGVRLMNVCSAADGGSNVDLVLSRASPPARPVTLCSFTVAADDARDMDAPVLGVAVLAALAECWLVPTAWRHIGGVPVLRTASGADVGIIIDMPAPFTLKPTFARVFKAGEQLQTRSAGLTFTRTLDRPHAALCMGGGRMPVGDELTFVCTEM